MTELRAITDTVIAENYPAKNYGGITYLRPRNVTDRRVVAPIQVPMIPPYPGAVITSAVLRYFAAEVFPSATFTLYKWTGKWAASTITWSNRPSTAGTAATVTDSGAVGKAFDFDITSTAQAWLAGTPNYGLRLDTTSTAANGRAFFSSRGPAQYRPVVLVEWSAPPAAPYGFRATGGAQVSVASPVLPWVYSDPAGLPMAAYQYQQNSVDSWGSPSVDTGEVASSVPQHQASGLTDGQDFLYRSRHKNSAGIWSPWSEAQESGRTNKPTLTVLTPGAVANDVTPTVSWDLDATQSWAEVKVAGTTTPLSVTSPRLDEDAADWEVTRPLNGPEGEVWNGYVRAADDVLRASTPGDPAYVEAAFSFTIEPADGIATVTSFVVDPDEVLPAPRLSWRRTDAPDGWRVARRVEGGLWVYLEVGVGESAEGGTAYSWADVSAPPQRDLEYRVHPLVNGEMGEAPVVQEFKSEPRYIYLLDPDDPTWVLPVAGNDQGTWELAEESSVVTPRGSDRSYLVHEGLGGYVGSISGLFYSDLPYVGGLTAQQMRDRAWRLKREPLKVWRLVLGDMNIPVLVHRVNPTPRPGPEVSFGVSFQFLQQGELWWED